MNITCTECGIALKVRRPLRSAARWVHTAIPPIPHVAETASPIPSEAPSVNGVDRATFDRILDLEKEARITRAVAGMRVGGGAADLRDRDRLFAAIDDLTPEQAAAFGAYRLSHI